MTTLRTKNRVKWGTVEYQATVNYGVPVTDTSPDRRIDFWRGDDEYVDDFESERFASLPDAERWIRRRCRAHLNRGVIRVDARIEVVEWVDDEYVDPATGDTVLDAYEARIEIRVYDPDRGTLRERVSGERRSVTSAGRDLP